MCYVFTLLHFVCAAEWLASLMQRSMAGMFKSDQPKPDQLLDEVNFDGVVKYIKENKCKRIVTMAGAGISTCEFNLYGFLSKIAKLSMHLVIVENYSIISAAGIPDFRSPGTGLYDNLQKYNLPSPQAIFEIEFFRVGKLELCYTQLAFC